MTDAEKDALIQKLTEQVQTLRNHIRPLVTTSQYPSKAVAMVHGPTLTALRQVYNATGPELPKKPGSRKKK